MPVHAVGKVAAGVHRRRGRREPPGADQRRRRSPPIERADRRARRRASCSPTSSRPTRSTATASDVEGFHGALQRDRRARSPAGSSASIRSATCSCSPPTTAATRRPRHRPHARARPAAGRASPATAAAATTARWPTSGRRRCAGWRGATRARCPARRSSAVDRAGSRGGGGSRSTTMTHTDRHRRARDRIAELDWPALDRAARRATASSRHRPSYTAAECRELAASLRRRPLPLDASTCAATASARASTGTSTRRCPALDRAGAPRALPAAGGARERLGASASASRRPTRPTSTGSSTAATRAGQTRADAAASCATSRAATTRCTRTSTATSRSRSRRSPSLNRAGHDFAGGQFVLVEQRPRAQSRAHVIDLERGALPDLPDAHAAGQGSRGYYRTTMRHGVATVHARASGPRSA